MKQILLLQFILLWSNSVFSNIDYYYPYVVSSSASNYGNTGLMELPNARLSDPATLRFNYSSSFPFEFTSVTATPYEWLEATYRYTEIENVLYGPSGYSGNQSLKDKGFDVKFRVFKENFSLPSVVLGMRDIAGTGRFSSEYIVASKAYKDFDFTLGLGWGLLGKEGNIKKPLNFFGENFNARTDDQIKGGEFSINKWFSGDASLLAGIEYDFKRYGLRLKLEYDPTQPDVLPNGSESTLDVDSRFNIGLTYSYTNFLDIQTSFERGNQFRIGFSLKGNFFEDTIPKPGPKNVLSLNQEQKQRSYSDKSIFYRSLNKSLRDEGIFLQATTYEKDEVNVSIASTKYFSFTRPVGRTARIVEALSADTVKRINISPMNGDIEVATISLDRQEIRQYREFQSSSNELFAKSKMSSSSEIPLYQSAEFIPRTDFPEFNWVMSPSLKHQIGGPEAFYLGQLLWQTDLSLKLARKVTLFSSFGLNIYDTFNNLANPSQSSIPRVRSDIQKYLQQGKNNLKRLNLEYMSSPYKDLFIRADIGYLEEMFAAVGGEILYRPFDKKFALGVELHKVKQRGYKQRLSFLDYENYTGHFSFYQNLPSGTLLKISAGEYLAGDKGVTADISRRFSTGFTLGIFATKTNLSDEEFGEGSFDKGFYFSIPVKLFYADFRTGNISFGLHPLTKDGGAMLNVPNKLYGIVGDTNSHSLQRDWKYILD